MFVYFALAKVLGRLVCVLEVQRSAFQVELQQYESRVNQGAGFWQGVFLRVFTTRSTPED